MAAELEGEGERDHFKEEFKRFKKKSTDLREVLDMRERSLQKSDGQGTSHSHQPTSSPSDDAKAETLGLKPPSQWHVLSLPDIPGLLLLPDLFLPGGQHHWVKRCLLDYPCKPNLCNLDAHMQRSGTGSLWSFESEEDRVPKAKKARLHERGAGIAKDTPLYRLRWVTLGYHYDWDTKEYSKERCSLFPADLSDLSAFILHHAGFQGFKAEAAIVNYYHLDSSLSGHTDHSEKDLTQPLLSLSFGQSAIFLIGGKTKQTKPTPILLRSGDIVVMSREARLAYHGVPRILPPSEGVQVPPCLTAEAIVHGVWCGWGEEGRVKGEGEGEQESCAHCVELTSVWDDVMSYLSVSRINVNIRQVVSEHFHF